MFCDSVHIDDITFIAHAQKRQSEKLQRPEKCKRDSGAPHKSTCTHTSKSSVHASWLPASARCTIQCARHLPMTTGKANLDKSSKGAANSGSLLAVPDASDTASFATVSATLADKRPHVYETCQCLHLSSDGLCRHFAAVRFLQAQRIRFQRTPT